jgi:hypothetical protein
MIDSWCDQYLTVLRDSNNEDLEKCNSTAWNMIAKITNCKHFKCNDVLAETIVWKSYQVLNAKIQTT